MYHEYIKKNHGTLDIAGYTPEDDPQPVIKMFQNRPESKPDVTFVILGKSLGGTKQAELKKLSDFDVDIADLNQTPLASLQGADLDYQLSPLSLEQKVALAGIEEAGAVGRLANDHSRVAGM